jgi:hypothetical protein
VLPELIEELVGNAPCPLVNEASIIADRAVEGIEARGLRIENALHAVGRKAKLDERRAVMAHAICAGIDAARGHNSDLDEPQRHAPLASPLVDQAIEMAECLRRMSENPKLVGKIPVDPCELVVERSQIRWDSLPSKFAHSRHFRLVGSRPTARLSLCAPMQRISKIFVSIEPWFSDIAFAQCAEAGSRIHRNRECMAIGKNYLFR